MVALASNDGPRPRPPRGVAAARAAWRLSLGRGRTPLLFARAGTRSYTKSVELCWHTGAVSAMWGQECSTLMNLSPFFVGCGVGICAGDARSRDEDAERPTADNLGARPRRRREALRRNGAQPAATRCADAELCWVEKPVLLEAQC